MINVPELSDQTFDQEVRGTPAAVVCFCAPGCPANDLEDLARDYAGRVKFAVLDVCDNVETPGELGVLGFPTLVFFKEGHEVCRRFGPIKKQRLVDDIRTNLRL